MKLRSEGLVSYRLVTNKDLPLLELCYLIRRYCSWTNLLDHSIPSRLNGCENLFNHCRGNKQSVFSLLLITWPKSKHSALESRSLAEGEFEALIHQPTFGC